jgi:hypothetical protein
MSNFYIATTRFTNETYEQNKYYRNKLKINGALYGSPTRIKENIPLDSNIFVIEMNNSQNRIEGIGLIVNTLYHDKYYRIYNDKTYYPGKIYSVHKNKAGQEYYDIIYDDGEVERNVDKTFIKIESETNTICKGDKVIVNCRKRPNKDYNRCIYKGDNRIDISSIQDPYFQKVINVLEQLLFKGDKHCKRAQGITELPKWILQNKYKFDFVKCFKNIFKI